MKRGQPMENPRTISYRLHPNKEQVDELFKWRLHYNRVHNQFLEELNLLFKNNGFDLTKAARIELEKEWKISYELNKSKIEKLKKRKKDGEKNKS